MTLYTARPGLQQSKPQWWERELAEIDELILGRAVYCDTLGLMMKRPLSHDERYYLRLIEGRTIYRSRKAIYRSQKAEHDWPWIQLFQQPSFPLLEAFGGLGIKHKIGRIDAVLDLIARSKRDADRLRGRLRRHLVTRRGREHIIWDEKHTTDYYARPGAAIIGRIYADKPCKLQPDRSCCHLELEAKGPDYVRRCCGFTTVADVTEASVTRFLRRKLTLYRLADPFAFRLAVQRQIEREVVKSADSHYKLIRDEAYEREVRRKIIDKYGRYVFGLLWEPGKFADDGRSRKWFSDLQKELAQGTPWHRAPLQNLIVNFRPLLTRKRIVPVDNGFLFDGRRSNDHLQ